MTDEEGENHNLTAELSSRQGDLREGDVVIVKLRNSPGWVKLQLTSKRVKGHRGRWFNYKNLTPDLGGDPEGSVNLLPQGRWYIFASEEDDQVIAPLIAQDDGLIEAQLEAEKTHISAPPSRLSDDDYESDPLGINKLIDEIKELGSSSSTHEASTPILNEDVYEQYHKLEHNHTPIDLFENETFEYRISRDNEQLGDLFDLSISALEEARSLYYQVRDRFVALHQPRVPDKSRILQALKLSDTCVRRIKSNLRNLNQEMIDSESVPREVQVRFEEDAYDQCKVLQTYIEVCTLIASEPPSPQHSTPGHSSRLNDRRKISRKKRSNGLFSEVDRAAQIAEDITRRSKARVDSIMGSKHSVHPNNLGGQPSPTQLRKSLKQAKEIGDDHLSSHSSSSSSGSESEAEQVNQFGGSARQGMMSGQLSEADLKAMSRMEQSLSEMKERTVKVLKNNVKSSEEIRQMDENSLLTMSKYGPSTWASAIEKLDSARYTTKGCLRSLKMKLSARKVHCKKNPGHGSSLSRIAPLPADRAGFLSDG